jgi:hypothetical protein
MATLGIASCDLTDSKKLSYYRPSKICFFKSSAEKWKKNNVVNPFIVKIFVFQYCNLPISHWKCIQPREISKVVAKVSKEKTKVLSVISGL